MLLIYAILKHIRYKHRSKEVLQERQERIETLNNLIRTNGFIVSKQLRCEYPRFLVDDVNKKFATFNSYRMDDLKIYNYSDILHFDLEEDGRSVASGSLAATAVGAFGFGLAGAWVGANSKRELTCTSLVVRIFVNDLQDPQIDIVFIDREVKKNSQNFQSAISEAKELIATLTYIQNQ